MGPVVTLLNASEKLPPVTMPQKAMVCWLLTATPLALIVRVAGLYWNVKLAVVTPLPLLRLTGMPLVIEMLLPVLLGKSTVWLGPRAKAGTPTETGGVATLKVATKSVPGTPLLLPSSGTPNVSVKPLVMVFTLRRVTV